MAAKYSIPAVIKMHRDGIVHDIQRENCKYSYDILNKFMENGYIQFDVYCRVIKLDTFTMPNSIINLCIELAREKSGDNSDYEIWSILADACISFKCTLKYEAQRIRGRRNESHNGHIAI